MGSLLIEVLLTRLPIVNSMQTSTYTCFTPYLDCLFIFSMLYTLDESLSSQYHPSKYKRVKVCICDAEEYGLPSMSVKTTPKFEKVPVRYRWNAASGGWSRGCSMSCHERHSADPVNLIIQVYAIPSGDRQCDD